MIRVLNVMGSLQCGGSETTVMNYFRHIDRTKVQFDFLITVDDKNYYEDEAVSLGARIFRRPMRTKRPVVNALKLINTLRKNPEIKIVHIHNSTPIVAIDVFLAMLMGVPVRIVHSHSNNPNKIFMHKFFQFVLRLTATHGAGCSIDAGISLFGRKGWDIVDTRVINNARDLKSFRYNESRRQYIRDELGLNNKIVLINVARLHDVKNHVFLLNSFSYAYKKKSNLVLLIVGDGNLRAELEEKAASLSLGSAIRFLGMRNDVADLLQAADLFLLPSLHEGLPGVAIEAQAAGLRCFVSDTVPAGVRVTDLVEFLPIHGSPKIWGNKILNNDVIARRDMMDAVSASGYNISDAAKELEKLYSAVYGIHQTDT